MDVMLLYCLVGVIIACIGLRKRSSGLLSEAHGKTRGCPRWVCSFGMLGVVVVEVALVAWLYSTFGGRVAEAQGLAASVSRESISRLLGISVGLVNRLPQSLFVTLSLALCVWYESLKFARMSGASRLPSGRRAGTAVVVIGAGFVMLGIAYPWLSGCELFSVEDAVRAFPDVGRALEGQSAPSQDLCETLAEAAKKARLVNVIPACGVVCVSAIVHLVLFVQGKCEGSK